MLLLMRHGPTQLNNTDATKDRIRGWLNIPLSDEGKKIAADLANQAKDFPIADLKSSDLSRAADTADAIHKTTGVPVTTHVELRPWDLGSLSGQPTEKALPIIKSLVSHPDEKAPGGGESFDDFIHRFIPFVKPLLDGPELHGVVTHIRNIKAIEALIAGKGQLDRKTWDQVPAIDPGGMVLASSDGFKPLTKESANKAGVGS